MRRAARHRQPIGEAQFIAAENEAVRQNLRNVKISIIGLGLLTLSGLLVLLVMALSHAR